jgi:hypothetical protein
MPHGAPIGELVDPFSSFGVRLVPRLPAGADPLQAGHNPVAVESFDLGVQGGWGPRPRREPAGSAAGRMVLVLERAAGASGAGHELKAARGEARLAQIGPFLSLEGAEIGPLRP